MVEKKKSGYWLTHLGLILGVLFIFFPVWLTFVASTVTQDAIIYPPLPMLPGTEFFENYANALFRGSPEGYGAKVPVIKNDDQLCNHGHWYYSWKNNHFIIVSFCICLF